MWRQVFRAEKIIMCSKVGEAVNMALTKEEIERRLINNDCTW